MPFKNRSALRARALRRPLIEPLESRQLLSVAAAMANSDAEWPAASALQNATNPCDVNADGKISPVDALVVINRLDSTLAALADGAIFPDVDGDQRVAPLDALMVINTLESAAQTVDTVSPLAILPSITTTAEKPQSKVWRHGDNWWAVLADGSGSALWRLDGTNWTKLQTLDAGQPKADVLAIGDVVHILLANGLSTKLVSLQYVDSPSPGYEPWAARPEVADVPLSGNTVTSTLAVDSTGRMWVAYDTQAAIQVRWADAPYSTFSAPVVLVDGVTNTDISAVVAMGSNHIGVMWSNQVTQRFGFRLHHDGDAPDAWSADEVPGGADAIIDGTGLANDHIHLAAAVDGTLYAAVKTGYQSLTLPSIGLFVRRPNGVWDPLHLVDNDGSRPTVVVNDATGKVLVAYRAKSNRGPIIGKQSDLATIAFGAPLTLIASTLVADPTTTKQPYNGQLVVLSSTVSGVLGGMLITNSPPVVIAGADQTVGPAGLATLTGSVVDTDGPAAPTALWSLVSGPGTVTLTDATSPTTPVHFSAPGVYELRLESFDGEYTRSDNVIVTVDATRPTVAIAAVTPDPTLGPVDAIQINFSEPVIGFDLADLSLTRGAGNLLTGAESLTSSDGKTWTLAGLTSLTNRMGTFTLTLTAAGAGIADLVANTLTAGAVESFTVDLSTPYSIYPLSGMTLGATTGEKPQAKVWKHGGVWWSVLANSSGTGVFRLDGATWTQVLSLSSTKYRADVKPVGDGSVVHVLLFSGTSSKLASVEYVPGGAGSYKLWTTRSSITNLTLSSGVESASLEIDSTGRMWVASDAATDIEVRSAAHPYSSFSAAFKVASGANSDDISDIVAFGGNNIGVLWSNQTTKRFGFRVHEDSAATTTWLTAEVPAAASAQNIGGGMADDHVNLAVASDGTVYAAVRTAYNTAGQTAIGLLIRRPNGTWDPLHQVDTAGTNPMVVLNESTGRLLVAYGSTATGGPVVYKESLIGDIAFGPARTLFSGAAVNNPTSLRDAFTGELVILASTSTSLVGAMLGVNSGPTTSAGPDRTVAITTPTALDGTVTDDMLPVPHVVTTQWSMVSGPGTVTFANAAAIDTTATFSDRGQYVLKLTATDGQFSSFDEVTLDVEVPNLVPIIGAGPDQTILTGQTATLAGTASDDGEPVEIGTLTALWSQASGPGTVNFADASLPATTATFSARGLYVLRLEGHDGAKTDFDEVTILVTVPNAPPVVTAGPDRLVPTGVLLDLAGSATDDGEPLEIGTLTYAWSKTNGPGTVAFANAAVAQTSATFSAPGQYVLTLSVYDGGATSSDTLIVDVINPGLEVIRTYQNGVLPTATYVGTDDTKLRLEKPTENFGSAATLEADADPVTVSLVRWNLTEIPADAILDSASVTFHVSGPSADSFALHRMLSTWTENKATWQLASEGVLWGAPGAAGPADHAAAVLGTLAQPALGANEVVLGAAGLAVVQAWINDQSQNHGLYLAHGATGDAVTIASSESLTLESRPQLNLHWRLPGAPPPNSPPSVNAGADRTVPLHIAASLDGTVTDDNLPSPPAATTVLWSKVSGPGTVTFGNTTSVDTTATFSSAGTYILRLSANDGGAQTTDDISLTVEDLSIPVSRSYQDGVFPTAAYAGTIDTKIRFEKPTTNYKTATTLDADGDPDYAMLLKWDISDIPAGSSVQSASIVFDVLGATADNYELYPMLRAWTENGATWTQAAAGTNWATAGADGTADRGTSPLGTLSAPAIGPATVNLSPAGLAAVQGWINNAGANFGIVLQDYLAATDALSISSRDALTATARPRLNVTYLAPGAPTPNHAPSVSAGPDRSTGLGATISLDGTVTDDGLPTPPGATTIAWTRVSGPGVVTFGSPSLSDTTAGFSQAGNYVLRLTAGDGSLTSTDDVTVSVADLTQPISRSYQDGVFPTPAYQGTRDTKLRASNPTANYKTSTILEVDGDPDFGTLMQWDISDIPASSTVQSASIVFDVLGATADTYELYPMLRAWSEVEASWAQANAATAWATAGAVGAADRASTPMATFVAPALGATTIPLGPSGIAAVQNWINNPSANFGFVLQDYLAAADALSISSREALTASARPRLNITYLLPGAPTPNQPPVVSAGPDRNASLGIAISLDGTVTDDGRPTPPATTTIAWTKVSGPGTVTFGSPTQADTSATFSLAGSYVLRLSANDSQLSTSDDVTVTVVDPTQPVTLSFQDGVFPTPAYQGTRDTKLRAANPTTNYKNSTMLDIDGDPDFVSLLGWNLSQIPTTAAVQSVSISVNIAATSVDGYEIYALARNWVEAEATWMQASATSPWDTAGGSSPSDINSTVLGTIDASVLGQRTVVLNAAGVAAVQSWISNPATNFGLAIEDLVAATDAMTFNSRELLTPELRPKISITYLPGSLVNAAIAGAPSAIPAALADSVFRKLPKDLFD